jgi:hypothetical protein
MNKKIFNIEKYHKQFISIFKEKRKNVKRNEEKYKAEISELVELRAKVERLYENENESEELQFLSKVLDFIKKKIQGIYDIINHKEEKEYTKKANVFLSIFKSLPYCMEKRRISMEYMLEFSPSTYFNDIKNRIRSNECVHCGSKQSTTLRPGEYQCKECLYITEHRIENVLVLDINPNSVTRSNNYRKSMYFESHIDKLRMLKTPKVDPSVYQNIRTYMNVYQVNKLTANKLREILKHYKYSNLYKHIPYILCRMNNDFIPSNIAEKDVERLNSMFIEIETAWIHLYSKKKKKSFFGYAYCLRKVLELLENYDDHLKLIPLTNSKPNLDKNDRIWRKICEHNEWEFIPTYRLW